MPGFFTSYVKAALFSSTDDNGEPLDKNYIATDISPDTLGRMKDDCMRFERSNGMDLRGLEAGKAGADFWLTRNGHGAGFWDGDYPDDIGERLTKSAQSFGTFDLCVGDNGQIHGA
jgi:hypothetical protein